MADLLTLHRLEADRFGDRVRAVEGDQWHRETPCTEWDVRALVNHLVYDNCWAPLTVGGSTVAEVGDRFEGDLLGDDPPGAWQSSIEPALAAFEAPGALDRTVHLSYGDVPAAEYLVERLTDLVVHGWDLARSIGLSDRLDPDSVELLWETWAPREGLIRGSGLFGQTIAVVPDADRQTRLLALLGRQG